ncbi:MAG: hypothetical protein RL077_2565 [Verrucomicrobiota bacterium]
MPSKNFRKMKGISQAHRRANFRNGERRAEQKLTRFLELPGDDVAFGGNAEVTTKQFQNMRTAPADDRREVRDLWREVKSFLDVGEQTIQLLRATRPRFDHRRCGAANLTLQQQSQRPRLRFNPLRMQKPANRVVD